MGSTAKPEEVSDGGQADSSTPSIGLSSPLLAALKSLACGIFDSLVPDSHAATASSWIDMMGLN